jgi:hypothetical protein
MTPADILSRYAAQQVLTAGGEHDSVLANHRADHLVLDFASARQRLRPPR